MAKAVKYGTPRYPKRPSKGGPRDGEFKDVGRLPTKATRSYEGVVLGKDSGRGTPTMTKKLGSN